MLTGNLYFVWGVFFKCQYSVKKCDVWVLELVEWGDNIGVKIKGDFKEWVVLILDKRGKLKGQEKMISEKGRTNQSPCQFLGPSSTVFHLQLWQFSFYWIVSSGVKSSIDVFLPILSVWFSLHCIPLLFWLWLWLCSKWKPTLRILGIQAIGLWQ